MRALLAQLQFALAIGAHVTLLQLCTLKACMPTAAVRRCPPLSASRSSAALPATPHACLCSMMILYFFVARAYLARLTAMSAVTTYRLAVSSWTGLVVSGEPVGLVAGSAAAAWLAASTAPFVTAITPQLRSFDALAAATDAVRNGSVLALVTEAATANYVSLSPPCDATRRLMPVIDSRFSFGAVAYGYFANYSASPAAAAVYGSAAAAAAAPIAPSLPATAAAAIDLALCTAVEQSRVQFIADAYVRTAGNCASAPVVTASPITPDQLRGPFFIWGVGVALIVIAVAIERWGGCVHCMRTQLRGRFQQSAITGADAAAPAHGTGAAAEALAATSGGGRSSAPQKLPGTSSDRAADW